VGVHQIVDIARRQQALPHSLSCALTARRLFHYAAGLQPFNLLIAVTELPQHGG
jgi:hypothetical protein